MKCFDFLRTQKMASLVLNLTNDGSVRGIVLPDGGKLFSCYDYINIICQKQSGSSYGRTVYCRLISENSEFKDEIKELSYYHRIKGFSTPTMEIEGLMKLLNILGGKVSRAFRIEVLTILQRYLDGDVSLCSEIKHNKMIGKEKSYSKFAQTVIERANNMMATDMLQMPKVSFVYGTCSDAFPNLIKIGRTDDINARLIQLNTSCAPKPHVLVALAQTFDSMRDESLAHEYFASVRRQGEFFELSVQDITSFFASHVTPKYQQALLEHVNENQRRACLRT